MSSDDGAWSLCVLFVGMLAGGLVGGCEVNRSWQNEIVRRGHGEIVVTDDGREFRFKGESDED